MSLERYSFFRINQHLEKWLSLNRDMMIVCTRIIRPAKDYFLYELPKCFKNVASTNKVYLCPKRNTLDFHFIQGILLDFKSKINNTIHIKYRKRNFGINLTLGFQISNTFVKTFIQVLCLTVKIKNCIILLLYHASSGAHHLSLHSTYFLMEI